jgi:hypothetical protein
MSAKRWVSLFVFGATLVSALGLVAVFATLGSAAGTNICPSAGPTCITTSLFPRYLAVGSPGLAIAKFTNEASSTATHTVVTVNLPAGTQAVSVSSNPSASCTTAPASCSFGSVSGHAIVKVYVVFTAAAASSATSATSTVSFDEANGNTGSPTNDTVVSGPSSPIAVVDTGASGALNGKCTGASVLSASIASQTITATYADAVGGLPCTPVDTGVDLTNVVSGSNDRIMFVDLPALSGDGLATVVLAFSTLPAGSNVNNFVLREIPGYPASIGDPATWPTVPACVNHAPPSGDSCIDRRAKFGTKGIELTLKVRGVGVDPSYWG